MGGEGSPRAGSSQAQHMVPEDGTSLDTCQGVSTWLRFLPFLPALPATLLRSSSLVSLWDVVPLCELALLFHISRTLRSLCLQCPPGSCPSHLKDQIKTYLTERPSVAFPTKGIIDHSSTCDHDFFLTLWCSFYNHNLMEYLGLHSSVINETNKY